MEVIFSKSVNWKWANNFNIFVLGSKVTKNLNIWLFVTSLNPKVNFFLWVDTVLRIFKNYLLCSIRPMECKKSQQHQNVWLMNNLFNNQIFRRCCNFLCGTEVILCTIYAIIIILCILLFAQSHLFWIAKLICSSFNIAVAWKPLSFFIKGVVTSTVFFHILKAKNSKVLPALAHKI